MLKFAAICPHPPIIVPSIGKEELEKVSSTVRAMKDLSLNMRDQSLDTIVIISPHGPYQADFMSVNDSEILKGDFLNFGSEVTMKFENDRDLASSIKKTADLKKIPVEMLRNDIPLDHGTMVPLFYLTKNCPDLKIVPLSFSQLDYGKHYEFGKAIYQAISSTDKNVGLIASGDLSHRLTLDAPAGYSPSGKKFDDTIVNLIEDGNVDEILRMDSRLIEEAGECGLRSIIIALGALSGVENTFELMSYEGPFGVGYLVGKFIIS